MSTTSAAAAAATSFDESIDAFEADAAFGFLEAPRTLEGSILPEGAAWDDLRSIADNCMRAPCDPGAYRAAVLRIEKDRGEDSARAAEDAVAGLTVSQVAHVYSTLTLMAQKFIYADPGDVRHFVPRIIGRPWIKAGERRGTPLSLTYDALVIGNWRLRDATLPPTIDNIDALITVNGAEPERGFIRVHVAIEAAGGDLPRRMLNLSSELAAISDSVERTWHLNEFLNGSLDRIEQMRDVVACMWREVSRDEYWKQVRVTLLGTPEEAFPEGVRIVSTDTILYRKGGSGAQSPLMHAIDRFFAVDHVDGDMAPSELNDRQRLVLNSLDAPPEHARKFINDQVNFMSVRHRAFHQKLHSVPTVRDLVHQYGDATSVTVYNACVAQLEKWRKVHQKMAHKYIADKATPMKPGERPDDGIDKEDADVVASGATANVQHSEDKHGGGTQFVGANRGTQHSNFMPLLSQLIRETQHARILHDDGTVQEKTVGAAAAGSGNVAAGGGASNCCVM